MKNNSLRFGSFHGMENYLTTLLDVTKDDLDKITKDLITQLPLTFTDADDCIDFLTEIQDKKVLLIISECLSQQMIPLIRDIPQLHSIYLSCNYQEQHEELITEYKKVKGTFTDIESIYNTLRRDVRQSEMDSISISCISATTSINLEELDQSFMYSQLLKEIILDIKYDEKAKRVFIHFCRLHHIAPVNIIDEFDQGYELSSPIWWYTKEPLVYSTINKALRNQDIEMIIKMAFFVQDLHREIKKSHTETPQTSTMIVYRGQGMSNIDFETIRESEGGLLSFNNFLSTSTDRAVSFAYAESAAGNSDLTGVLFEMLIDSSISSTPFVSVNNSSYYHDSEEEILFSMHTVFRIHELKRLEDRLWEVHLILTNDHDQQLKTLTNYIRNEIHSESGWQRMAVLMIKMGKYDKAIEIYETLFKITSDNEQDELRISFIANYNNTGSAYHLKGDFLKALAYYEKVLSIWQTSFSPNDPTLATLYNNIGEVYRLMENYSLALLYYQKTLEMKEKFLPLDHLEMVLSYNSIGLLYHKLENYSVALSYFEKVFEIQSKFLPSNHPDLANTYSTIAGTYDSMGDYPSALSFYKKSMSIQQRTLPSDHPALAQTYCHIGGVQGTMGDYRKAIETIQKAINIQEKTILPNHPDLTTTYNAIGTMYQKNGNYSAALTYFEKTLKIQQESLPTYHSELSITYRGIGEMYYLKSNYPSALSFYEKTLEIQHKSLPSNSAEFASTYMNIGLVYQSMGKYSEALSNYRKTVEIQHETLLPNHPTLAHTYSNIGELYRLMGDYSEAFLNHKKALAIRHQTLPSNHSDLGTTCNNIAAVLCSQNNYQEVLPFFEKTLEIYQASLPPDHPELATTHNNIGEMYRSMNKYTVAIHHYGEALKIMKTSLTSNHLSLGMLYSNMSMAFNSLGRYESAVEYIEQAVRIFRDNSGVDHDLTKANQAYLDRLQQKM